MRVLFSGRRWPGPRRKCRLIRSGDGGRDKEKRQASTHSSYRKKKEKDLPDVSGMLNKSEPKNWKPKCTSVKVSFRLQSILTAQFGAHLSSSI